MKKELYTFEKDGVNLQFSFDLNEKNKEAKKIFIELMEQATEALKKELSADTKEDENK